MMHMNMTPGRYLYLTLHVTANQSIEVYFFEINEVFNCMFDLAITFYSSSSIIKRKENFSNYQNLMKAFKNILEIRMCILPLIEGCEISPMNIGVATILLPTKCPKRISQTFNKLPNLGPLRAIYVYCILHRQSQEQS